MKLMRTANHNSVYLSAMTYEWVIRVDDSSLEIRNTTITLNARRTFIADPLCTLPAGLHLLEGGRSNQAIDEHRSSSISKLPIGSSTQVIYRWPGVELAMTFSGQVHRHPHKAGGIMVTGGAIDFAVNPAPSKPLRPGWRLACADTTIEQLSHKSRRLVDQAERLINQ